VSTLEAHDGGGDLHADVNSPGGSVTAGLAIYDTMQWVSCDVATYCIGQCASMGSLLLAAGAKGKRFALPHGRIMIHQPLAGMEGTATDILIHAEEFIRMKKQLNGIYQKHTGQTLARLEEDTDRDRFMSPEEAKDVPQAPGSLDAALNALEKDNAFLLKGDVFTPDVISTWIEYKRENELDQIRLRPHPHEFALYFDN